MKGRIERIEVKNYRVLKDVSLNDLPALTVVVGENGTGKSTLFDVFSFLKEALTDNVAAAVSRRGGFRELVSRGERGPISIQIKFRSSQGLLTTYVLEVSDSEQGPVISQERLSYKRGSHGRPWKFLDFKNGSGDAITDESAEAYSAGNERRENFVLADPVTLAIKSLGQLKKFPAALEFRELIDGWHISDFHIGDARPSAEAGYAEHLSRRGENVAVVAKTYFERNKKVFEKILQRMREKLPGVSDVQAVLTEDGRLVLKFSDGSFKDPFIARHVSDGTIKMFAYLVLLHDPKPHPLLAVEEPENQLYPGLMSTLIEEFREYAKRGGQVFVSTHSPDFLNGAELDEVFWLSKENGFAKVRRAKDSETLQRLTKEGDQMGALFRQMLLAGDLP
ncbi:MAG: AAA family ATPase [Fimbriimonadaceae bacterium]|nr:AAA family ATPase [Fimbriimonadaceae bacterium]